MALIQAPALDPRVQVPQQELPLGILDSLKSKYSDTIERAFEHIEERRFAAQNTCLITRPFTTYDLQDIETIKPEPEPIHDRRIVNDRGEPVSLEKGYFSGHPEPIEFKEEEHVTKETWKAKTKRVLAWCERQLKKVGLAYDE